MKASSPLPHDFYTEVALSIVLWELPIQNIHMTFTELTLITLALDKYQIQITNVLWERQILFPQELRSMSNIIANQITVIFISFRI